MRLARILKLRLRSLFGRGRVEDSLERELTLHLDQLTREFIAQGMTEPEARLEARRQFGSAEAVKEECRDARRVNLISDLARDVAYAIRSFRKSPGFALTAVLSLALGIGANTVVFSVLNALILRPPPVAAPDRIQFINNRGTTANSFPAYRDIRDRNTTFESVFAYRITQMAVGNESAGAHRVWGYLVTGNYFAALGIQPALGRFFTPAEDQHLNASRYAVLSHDCWRVRFAADPGIVGRDIRLNGRPYRVLGVAPPGFHGTEVFYWAEIWVPMMMQPEIEDHSWLECRGCGNAWLAGRLKDGVSIAQAQANLRAIAGQLAREYPVHEGMTLTLSPIGMAGSTGREPTRAFTGGILLLAVLVLLAACSNLAALQTARGVDRARELAIRLSIGATRGRIVRQLITESVVVAMVGGLGGIGIAVLLLRLLSQWRAPLEFPVQFDVTADWRVFLFGFLAALLTGVLLGLGLARRAWTADPARSIKGAGQQGHGRRWGLHDVLIPLQIALCCFLVTASLVAVRGLLASVQSPLGYQPDGISVVSYDLGFVGYDDTRGRAFDQSVLEDLARLPGVESAAYSSSVPLSLDQSNTSVYPESTVDFSVRNAFGATYYYVSPGYFRTIGTRLLAGREFTREDNAKSPVVAIVNQTFARRLVGTPDAVGHHFLWGRNEPVPIVAVVEDGKYETLTEAPKPVVFFPVSQQYSSTVVFIARSRRPEGELANEMRQLIARHNADLAVYGVGSLRQMLGLVYLPMHAAAIALGAFGILALMLAVTGIYGVSAYSVSRRSREIGIRVAIGARPRQILASVFGRLGRLVIAGALLGLGLAFAASSVLASIVYQATSRDPLIIAAAVASMALVSLAAAIGPARHSISIDPVRSLREE